MCPITENWVIVISKYLCANYIDSPNKLPPDYREQWILQCFSGSVSGKNGGKTSCSSSLPIGIMASMKEAK